jgi:hypothetical protein
MQNYKTPRRWHRINFESGRVFFRNNCKAMVHERKNKGKVLNYLVAIAKYLKCFTEIY